MHVLINVKSPNNISKWQMGFNSAFKGLINQDLNKTPVYKLKLLQSSVVIRGHVAPAEMTAMKDITHLNVMQSDQSYFGRTVRLLKRELIKADIFLNFYY
jgi:hypothetical protein